MLLPKHVLSKHFKRFVLHKNLPARSPKKGVSSARQHTFKQFQIFQKPSGFSNLLQVPGKYKSGEGHKQKLIQELMTPFLIIGFTITFFTLYRVGNHLIIRELLNKMTNY